MQSISKSVKITKRKMGTLKSKVIVPDNFDHAFADKIEKMFNPMNKNKPNIILKPFNDTQATAREFFALTDKNRAYLREWLPWLDTVQKVTDTHKFLSDNCQSDKLGTTLNFFICDNDKIIGTINLREITLQSALVGYWLDKSYSRQGITTNALQELIKIVQEKNLTRQIILRCNPQNMGSKKIALKCGFSYQETLKNAQNLYGVDIDLEKYILSI